MHVVCEYNNIRVSGEFASRMTKMIIIIIIIIRLSVRGHYDAASTTVIAPRGPANRRRGIVQRGRSRADTPRARNDNNRMRRVPPVERAPPEETRRSTGRTDRVRRAILLRAAAANRSFSSIPTLSVFVIISLHYYIIITIMHA